MARACSTSFSLPPTVPLPLGNGQHCECLVRLSAKARYARLYLSTQGQFTLVLPQARAYPPMQLAALLAQFAPWAERAWQRCQRHLAALPPLALPKHISLPLTGERLSLHQVGQAQANAHSAVVETMGVAPHRQGERKKQDPPQGIAALQRVAGVAVQKQQKPQHKLATQEGKDKQGLAAQATRVQVHEEGAQLVLAGETTDIGLCCLALQQWLVAKAKLVLPPLVHAMAADMGKKVATVRVRHQRTRWGSCSAGGHISLNCCALLLPVADARYLILHELCHLEHMNHSPAYRAYVAGYEAAWRQRERALGEAWLALPPWVQWR